MLGLAQGAFDKAVPYTYERKQFGQPVGTFQGMQFQIAQAAIDIEAARLLTYNAARRKDEGREFTKEAAMAKYWASVVAQRVSGSAIEWAGGVGFTRETGIEKFWRDSKIVSARVVVLRGVIDMRALGCDLRGNVQHSATNDCEVHPKAVFMRRGVTYHYGRNVLYICIIGGDKYLSCPHEDEHALVYCPAYRRTQDLPGQTQRCAVEESCKAALLKKIVRNRQETSKRVSYLPDSEDCLYQSVIARLSAHLHFCLWWQG